MHEMVRPPCDGETKPSRPACGAAGWQRTLRVIAASTALLAAVVATALLSVSPSASHGQARNRCTARLEENVSRATVRLLADFTSEPVQQTKSHAVFVDGRGVLLATTHALCRRVGASVECARHITLSANKQTQQANAILTSRIRGQNNSGVRTERQWRLVPFANEMDLVLIVLEEAWSPDARPDRFEALALRSTSGGARRPCWYRMEGDLPYAMRADGFREFVTTDESSSLQINVLAGERGSESRQERVRPYAGCSGPGFQVMKFRPADAPVAFFSGSPLVDAAGHLLGLVDLQDFETDLNTSKALHVPLLDRRTDGLAPAEEIRRAIDAFLRAPGRSTEAPPPICLNPAATGAAIAAVVDLTPEVNPEVPDTPLVIQLLRALERLENVTAALRADGFEAAALTLPSGGATRLVERAEASVYAAVTALEPGGDAQVPGPVRNAAEVVIAALQLTRHYGPIQTLWKAVQDGFIRPCPRGTSDRCASESRSCTDTVDEVPNLPACWLDLLTGALTTPEQCLIRDLCRPDQQGRWASVPGVGRINPLERALNCDLIVADLPDGGRLYNPALTLGETDLCTVLAAVRRRRLEGFGSSVPTDGGFSPDGSVPGCEADARCAYHGSAVCGCGDPDLCREWQAVVGEGNPDAGLHRDFQWRWFANQPRVQHEFWSRLSETGFFPGARRALPG